MDYESSLADSLKDLIISDPFYGSFAISLDKEFSRIIPTACVAIMPGTIDIKLVINPDFWGMLNKDMRVGLLKHELQHITNFHLFVRYPDRDLGNIAADLMINQYIPDNELPRAKNEEGKEIFQPILLSSFPQINLPKMSDTRTYYDILDKNRENDKNLNSLLQAMMEGKKVICSHDLWDDINGQSDINKDLIKRSIEEKIKHIFEDVLNKDASKLPGNLRNLIDMWGIIKPPVTDWKTVVRRFGSFCEKIKTKFSKNKLNKRFADENNIDSPPGMRIKFKKKLLVGIDTSGSISDKLFKDFLYQIHWLHKTGNEIIIVECDAAIGKIWNYKGFVNNITPTGGGGTSFTPVVNLLHKDHTYQGLIYFTDGYGSCETKITKPILWVIVNGDKNFSLPGTKLFVNLGE